MIGLQWSNELLTKLKWEIERRWGERRINFQGQGYINFIDVGSAGWLPLIWSKRSNTCKISPNKSFKTSLTTKATQRTGNQTKATTTSWQV